MRRCLAALSVVVALLAVSGLLPASTRAAGDLEVVAAARYVVVPGEARVHVTIDATATSTNPDPNGAYTGLSFFVQPGATHFVATSGAQSLQVRVTQRAQEYTALDLRFGAGVGAGESYPYRVAFDLVDQGGSENRDLRISRSIVAFPVWAFGSEGVPGGSVRVDLPAGYTPTLEGGQMDHATNRDGSTTLSSSGIRDPFAFFVYLSADRPGAFTSTSVDVRLGTTAAAIDVRAWDDDPAWGRRMAELLRRGLPMLQSLIGLDYDISSVLQVEEAATSRLGEYAGIYNDSTGLITVRYDADATVALHEAAHIWFNEALFPDRWIGEAWAEFYAVRAGTQLGTPGDTFTLDAELLKHRIPLNNWGAVGVESLDVEDFAYAATFHLAQLIGQRADLPALRRVWAAASSHQTTYQPAHPGPQPEITAAVTQDGWQRLLDLLEERTNRRFDDLWRAWVVNPQQAPLLDQRSKARQAYHQAVAAARSWELPRSIRLSLAAWQFTSAEAQIARARAILAQRDRIARESAALQLGAPSRLRALFEKDDGLTAAKTEADAELAALASLRGATALTAAQPSTLEWLGLLGTDPATDVAAARDAFANGDLNTTEARAAAAVRTRSGADSVGRQRLAIGGGSALGVDLLLMAGMAARRRRRRALTTRDARGGTALG